MKLHNVVLIILFSYSLIFAQGQAAVPFLLDQQSPLFYGAGEIGTAVPMRDPVGFYYNPAQLGYYSRNNSLSVFFMPANVTLYQLPSNYIRIHPYGYYVPDNIESRTFGLTTGYNFEMKGGGIPLSIGVGFLHYKIGYNGLYIPTWDSPDRITSLNSYDLFDSYSIGASYDYYLNFNLGLSLKSFKSLISSIPTAESPYSSLTASGTAIDFGAMIIAPFDNLFLKNAKYNIGRMVLKPVLKAAVGYSISNIGKKIYYIDPAQSDPIPRTARLGYNINLGINSNIAGVELPIIDYSYSAETEDLLVNQDSLGNISYKGLLGDINIVNNLLLLKGKNNIIIHKGHIFNFLNTFTFVTGRVSGGNLINIKTQGWSISSEGLFSILAANISSSTLRFVLEHFELEYYKSAISFSQYSSPNPEGIAIYFKGINI